MKGSHGMVQGYNGIALVDDRHQIIVQAEAFGNEQGWIVDFYWYFTICMYSELKTGFFYSLVRHSGIKLSFRLNRLQ